MEMEEGKKLTNRVSVADAEQRTTASGKTADTRRDDRRARKRVLKVTTIGDEAKDKAANAKAAHHIKQSQATSPQQATTALSPMDIMRQQDMQGMMAQHNYDNYGPMSRTDDRMARR